MATIASQSTLNLQFEMKPRILRSIKGLSSGAKDVYTYLYNTYTSSKSLGCDNIGQYLTASRKAISVAVGKSIKTVIGYIVELVKVGLIHDRRMGVQEVNRIYFIDVDDKYKRKVKSEPIEATDDELKESSESKGKLKQVMEMISPLQKITKKEAKGLLIAAEGDVSKIHDALKYVSVRSYDNIVSYIGDAIRRGYHKITTQDTTSSSQQRNPVPQHNQNRPLQSFHRVESHGHDAVAMEELLQSLNNGEITEEEYNTRLKALW